MPAKVSMLLLTTRSGRKALARVGYSTTQFVEEAKSALAETYKQNTRQELAADDIAIDDILDRENMGTGILMILAVPRGWMPRVSRQGIGSQTERVLRSRAMARGIEPDAIPKMQIETVLTEP